MFVWIITGNDTNYRQTYQLYIIIPVGRNCIGRFGYGPKLTWGFLSTPLQAVLCTMVIFSNGKILNKLFGNYSLWYVSDYIISKSLRNLLGCKVLGLCHFEPFCPFNVLSYFLHDLFSPGGYLSMSIIPK